MFLFLVLKGHFIVGAGDFKYNLPPEKAGDMNDKRSSPNDPFFIVYHTMLDCLFEQWLRLHPDTTSYPDVPKNKYTTGNRADSFIVPIFPVQTNGNMFKKSRYFGYACNIPNITVDSYSGSYPTVHFTMLAWLSAVLICSAMLY